MKVTKTTVAQGISKAVPIVGGVISGSLNYVSMMPMANRLNTALDKACFNYTEEEMAADIETIENIGEEAAGSHQPGKLSRLASSAKDGIQGGWKKASAGATSLLSKMKTEKTQKEVCDALISYDEKIETLRKLKGLVDEGILSQEEFDIKKKEILEL